MLERDYVMRLVRQFLETLEKLKEKKEADAFAVKKEIQQLYLTYFGHSATYFCQADVDEILSLLKSSYASNGLLCRMEMLAELYYYDASIKTSVVDRRKMWSKSLSFFEYIDSHSDTFSFERREKIAKIKDLLKQ